MYTFMASRQGDATITGMLALVASVTADAGTITHHDFPPVELDKDYPYTLYLPDGYEQSALEYPALNLLHGSFGNQNDWAIKGDLKQTVDRLIHESEIPPAVVVMPGAEPD